MKGPNKIQIKYTKTKIVVEIINDGGLEKDVSMYPDHKVRISKTMVLPIMIYGQK